MNIPRSVAHWDALVRQEEQVIQDHWCWPRFTVQYIDNRRGRWQRHSKAGTGGRTEVPELLPTKTFALNMQWQRAAVLVRTLQMAPSVTVLGKPCWFHQCEKTGKFSISHTDVQLGSLRTPWQGFRKILCAKS